MEKELLMTILISIAGILAIVVMTVKPLPQPDTDLIGLMVSQKGIGNLERALNLKILLDNGAIKSGSTIKVDDTKTVAITLSRDRRGKDFDQKEQDEFDMLIRKGNHKDQRKVHVDFSATHTSGCTVNLDSDYSYPYSVQWKPAATAATCGYGTYTLAATLIHEKAQVSATTTVTLETTTPTIIIQGYPVIKDSAVTLANPSFSTITTADTYPPAIGTNSQQIFASLMTPATQLANEQILFIVNVNGKKISGGTFNLDYRVYDATTSTIIGSGTITDPTTATASSLVFTRIIPSPSSHNVVFQFKSSSLFSALVLNSYDISMYRVAQ